MICRKIEILKSIEHDTDSTIERYYFNDIGVKELYSAKSQSEDFDFGRYSKERNRY